MPGAVRASVSPLASIANQPPGPSLPSSTPLSTPLSTTVRHAPEQAIEAPRSIVSTS
jgi:hypothetical protein